MICVSIESNIFFLHDRMLTISIYEPISQLQQEQWQVQYTQEALNLSLDPHSSILRHMVGWME